MNLTKEEAIQIAQTKGIEHFNSLNAKVYNENGKRINLKFETQNVSNEQKVDITKNSNPINIKENKMNTKDKKESARKFWTDVFNAKNTAGKEFSLNTKVTAIADVNAGYVDAVGAMQEEILDAPLLSKTQFIPMTQSTLRLPVLRLSGSIGVTAESGEKNATDGYDDYVLLSTSCYNGYVTYTHQVLNDVPAFQAFASRALVGMIKEDLEAAVVDEILAASGAYHFSGSSTSGVFTVADALNMYARLEQRNLSNPAWLLNPVSWVEAQQFDSGIRVIMDGPQPTILGIPVYLVAKLPVPASGAYGTAVLAGIGNVALGQLGDIRDEFNPYFGWTTNTVSTRVEVFADVAPTSNFTFTRTNGANSGWTSAHYVVYSGF